MGSLCSKLARKRRPPKRSTSQDTDDVSSAGDKTQEAQPSAAAQTLGVLAGDIAVASPFTNAAALLTAPDEDADTVSSKPPCSGHEPVLTTNCIVPRIPVAHQVLSLQPCHQLLESVQLVGCIGSGACALVYRGVYQGSECAIKFVCSRTLDKTAVREALVGPQLHHPQVVQTFITRGSVLTEEFMASVCEGEPGGGAAAGALLLPTLPSCGSDDGFGNPRKAVHNLQGWKEMLGRIGAMPGQTMVMAIQELCEYGNLHRAIQQGVFRPKEGQRTPHLARRSLLRTASEICRGMMHLHSASVVHGDLKPQNVLLSRSRVDRRGFTAKVADFGMSCVLGSRSKAHSFTGGTVAYMAPETFTGLLSKASDVFAMGCILWEMLTSRRCHEGLTVAQIAMGVALQSLELEWPDAAWPELCGLGRRCMAAEPAERPSFEDVEAALVEMETAVRNEGRARKLEEGKGSSSRLSDLSGVPTGSPPAPT